MFIESMFAIGGLITSMALVVKAAMDQTVQSFYEDNMAALKARIYRKPQHKTSTIRFKNNFSN